MIKVYAHGIETVCEMEGNSLCVMSEFVIILRRLRKLINNDDAIRYCIKLGFMSEDEIIKEHEKLEYALPEQGQR